MAKYIEAAIGKATTGKAREMGQNAASEALSKLKLFDPSLAIVFASSELNLSFVSQGIRDILDNCPLIGTSTAGEICNNSISQGVVISLLASPKLRVHVGIGEKVSFDYSSALENALNYAGIQAYFSPGHPLHQTLNIPSVVSSGLSSAFLIFFSPGSTHNNLSPSHDLQTMLRRRSANRIPIFGGSSADNFNFCSTIQMANDKILDDAIVLAFIESDILFGMGLAHGFSPTTKRALITRADGHQVHELDGRPADEVCAELLGVPKEKLLAGSVWFSKYPFGSTDSYGNQVLHVTEKLLNNGAIQFGSLMKTDQMITLMEGEPRAIAEAAHQAYARAVQQSDLKKPIFGMVFSCALRRNLVDDDGNTNREIEILSERTEIPFCGFYTYGEQGMSEDGLPIYSNQSASVLVISDELNPMAAIVHEHQNAYYEFKYKLRKKNAQMEAINRINQIIYEGTDLGCLLPKLCNELIVIFPWAYHALYLNTNDILGTYRIAITSDLSRFQDNVTEETIMEEGFHLRLNSHGKYMGALVLKSKEAAAPPKEEDFVLFKTIADLIAMFLHRIEMDGKLQIKLQQLEILNQLAHVLSTSSVSSSSQSKDIVKHIRRILKVNIASLWLVDQSQNLLIKEAMDAEGQVHISDLEIETDEIVTKWQIKHCQTYLYTPNQTATDNPFEISKEFPYYFVSLPILLRNKIRAVLNLYSFGDRDRWTLHHDSLSENMDFLRNVSGQVAVFMENRSLHKNKTFYKEMHHRVKNNLQNIVSLLRMQLRRVDQLSAKKALHDSISRIIAIATVHETLSQGEIGMLDLSSLIEAVSKQYIEGEEGPIISLDVSCPSIPVPSKQAVSLALVMNELIQNSVQHSSDQGQRTTVKIKAFLEDNKISLVLQDNGTGVPADFDIESHADLGLTIVNMLVKEDLQGNFTISGLNGTTARIEFSLPKVIFTKEESS